MLGLLGIEVFYLQKKFCSLPSYFKPPSTQLRKLPTTCDLPRKLSELLQRPLSKTSAASCENILRQPPIYWYSCTLQVQEDMWSTSACQGRWKSDAPFWSRT